MGFYDQLARYYDEVFPFNEDTYQFLKKNVTNGRVLDVGCSTGVYASKLNEDDQLLVKGIDINEEMIMLAKKRVGSASFEVQNMRDIDEKGKYQLIYSIGNSIVHLNDYDDVKDTIRKMLQALTSDGKLIIQIVNYARIFRQAIAELPIIETSHVKFSRFYQRKGGKILFKSILKTKLDKFNSEVLLYPLTKAEIEMIVEGFQYKVSFFGSFKGEVYDEHSFHLIAVIEK
jgi:2-polyprenyl-3-methyl-5-hydroxy-6-metoxy-1,4-benzoquinol methylase